MKKSAAYIKGFTLRTMQLKQAQLQLPDVKGLAMEHAGTYIADQMKKKRIMETLAQMGLLKTKPEIGVQT